MELTNREIRRIFGALNALSAKVLPSITSDLKVAALLRRHIGPAFQESEDVRQNKMLAVKVPDNWEGSQLPAAIVEERQRIFLEMERAVQTIPDVPERLLLSAEDMPKAPKNPKDLEEHRKGLSDIIACLGFLYPLEDAEE